MTADQQAAHFREGLECILDVAAASLALPAEQRIAAMVAAAQATLAGRGPLHPLLEPSSCRSCGAAIVWIQTAKGKRSPCDAARCIITTPAGVTVVGHQSHFASCPSAGDHRRASRR